MTFGTPAFLAILQLFCKWVKELPLDDPLMNRYDLHSETQVVVDDGLGRLRQYETLLHDNFQPMLCVELVTKYMVPIVKALANLPNLTHYVLCWDACDRSRPEKLGTHKEREKAQQKRPVVKVAIPEEGAKSLFQLNKVVPGTMSMIFGTPEARRGLYEMFSDFFKSEDFRALLPPGKTFVFSGARDSTGNTPPLCVAREGWRYADEWRFDTCSEGDTDVWRWVVHVFTKQNVAVFSGDGDIFLIGLIQMRYISKDRKVHFLHKRGKGFKFQSVEELQAKQRKDERAVSLYKHVLQSTGSEETAYLASGKSSARPAVRKSATNWIYYCVDMCGIHTEIITDPEPYNEYHVKYPVENFIAILVLASGKSDYVQPMRATAGLTSDLVFSTYFEGHHPGLVMGGIPEGHKSYHYFVDVQALTAFVDRCFERKKKSAKRIGKWKRENIKDEGICVVASQLAWLLHYWTMGCSPKHSVYPGNELDANGLPRYGYHPTDGWAETVDPSPIKVCPPMPAKKRRASSKRLCVRK